MSKKVNLVQVDPVKIKPFLGMKPGQWLTYLYILIILIVVFLVCFLPGIVKGQKRVTFTSPAGIAAVYIDGQYAGGTPFTTWVKSGEHTVEFKVYGNTIETSTLKVGHPVFLTWLFPRKMSFAGTQTVSEQLSKTIKTQFLSDVEQQSAVTAYDDRHHYPPLYQTFAGFGLDAGAPFMKLAFSYISSAEMLADAKAASQTMGLDYDFSIQDAIFTGTSDGSASSAFAKSQVPEASTITLSSDSLKASSFTIDGQLVSTGSFSMGKVQTELTYQNSVSALVSTKITEPFSIASSEITEYQFALFLKDNPEWSKDNLEALMAEGKADQYYLSGISTSLVFPSNKSVRNISYKAAQAFCVWLSEQTGRNVFIPTEKQWSAAFSALQSPSYQKSLVQITKSGTIDSMLGGVWEFTSTGFVPLSRAISVIDPSQAEADAEVQNQYTIDSDIVIKGGSYIDQQDAAAVGVMSTSECSETAGFRVAWN
ncbi:MAG: SUMF1/EgtB/PvdO family nonheme iron enzyme [Sphaerochaetaceae bacterium]|nr:SUMF1/EgtB/PvdO family nonheme iron enzyme [Sphaerochaetaceae bacterium]